MDRSERKELSKRVKYAHYRLSNEGRITIAYTSKSRDIGQQIYFAPAFCSPKDRFIRRTGRQIALQRLFTSLREGGCLIITAQSNKIKDVLSSLYKVVVNDYDTPKWVSKAA